MTNDELAKRFPELAAEWHPTQNGALKPENLSCSNDLVVWWVCSVCGTEFEMAIKHRTGRRDGCPSCSKRGTSFPEQALFYYISQVYPDAENKYIFEGVELDVYIPSKKVAIEYDGGLWHKNLKRDNKKDKHCFDHGIKLFRIRSAFLPKTDLAEYIPCHEDKESIESAIKQLLIKLQGDCPVDVDISRDELDIRTALKRYVRDNSLAVVYPDLAAELAVDLNNGLTAENLLWGAGARVWWRCSKCGYEWKTSPNHRTHANSKTGCPHCAITKTSEKNKTRVINLDTQEVFNSVTDAARSCNGHKGDICNCCKGIIKTASGFRWAYVDESTVRRRDYNGKVINLDTNEVFNTPNDAARSCNGDRRNIVQCCYGKTKTSYGYRWALFEEDKS